MSSRSCWSTWTCARWWRQSPGLSGPRTRSPPGCATRSGPARRLPRRLVVLAVSGSELGFGAGLGTEVAAAVRLAVQRVFELAESVASRNGADDASVG